MQQHLVGALPGIPVFAPAARGVADEHAEPREPLEIEPGAGIELGHVAHGRPTHLAPRPLVGPNAAGMPSVGPDDRVTLGRDLTKLVRKPSWAHVLLHDVGVLGTRPVHTDIRIPEYRTLRS